MAREAGLARGQRGIVDVAQRELRLAPEGESRVGGNDAARRSLQETRREFALQSADLLAERRGDDAQLERGLAHAAVFDDADKIS